MSNIEFDTPANRIIAQQQPKNQFRINTSLPDIAFLRQLSVQGRMRYFQGSDVTPITITPAIGETLFIGGGSWSGGSSATARTITISNDGNTREIVRIDSSQTKQGIFQFGIDSLVGNSIKQFTVTGSGATTNFNVWGWSENTSRIRDVTT